jgi:hypothetical protein
MVRRIMSNTNRHKIIAKFTNKIIGYSDVPLFVRKMWDRKNNDVGYYKAKKIKLREKYI